MSARRLISLLFCGVAAFSACSLVDEDLSDCGTSVRLAYELRLVTNFSTEMEKELPASDDAALKDALNKQLGGVFSDFGHDLNLSFYSAEAGGRLLLHESHVMDAVWSEYTVLMNKRPYRHIVVANVENNLRAFRSGTGTPASYVLELPEADTVGSQKTGLYCARAEVDLTSGRDRFLIPLYIANCAEAIVIDTLGSGVRSLEVCLTGFADGFSVSDSVFRFASPRIVRTEPVRFDDGTGRVCFAGVNFPSKDTRPTRSVLDGEDAFVSPDAENVLWQFRIYATTADGSVTKTVLGMMKPQRAGQFKIVKSKLSPGGAVDPEDVSVGVSVTLNWNKGIGGDIEL